MTCNVGDVLIFYGNQAASYAVNINGVTKITHNATTTPYLIGSYTVATGDSTFEILNETNTNLTSSGGIKTLSSAGIQQFANNNEVNFYPNPNNGSFVIEPQNTLYNVQCTVYDVNGKLVLSQTINGKTTIDANGLNEGVYNISLQSNEGVVNKRLVIVR